MIIDAHAHIFPDKICNAAVKGISDFYKHPVPHDGTPKTLISLGKNSGITRFLVHSVATVPKQVKHINDFLIDTVKNNPDSFIGFMAMHPDYSDIQGEIDRGISAGMKGIKLHPDFQQFCIDDPGAYPIYEAAQGRIPILFHTGDTRFQYSKPERLLKIIKDFPKLQVIGAHFGGWSEWNSAAEILSGEQIWVDSSSTSFWVPPERIKELINAYGTEHVLFGSDYPMWNPADELKAIERLKLPASQLDLILYKNAELLLKI